MKLFIDTTTTTLGREHTGIQRAVTELTIGMLNIVPSDQACPVCFISQNLLIPSIEGLRGRKGPVSQSLLSKIYFVIIDLIRDRAPILYKPIRYFYRLMKYNYLFCKSIRKAGHDFSRPARGDIYLVIDANWALDSDYIFFLKSLKEEGVNLIVVCYDLVALTCPEFFEPYIVRRFLNYYESLVKFTEKFICISKYTAHELERYLASKGNMQSEVTWAHLGFKKALFPKIEIRLPESVRERSFILTVSTVEPRKNHLTLVNAFKKANIDDLHLVIIGKDGWKNEEVRAKIIEGENVIWIKSADDAELGEYYRRCLFFVFPSLMEGYGLPLLEALSFGKFALCSNTGPLPELGGDFVDYFSPLDQEMLAELIGKYALDRKLLESKEKKIRADFKIRTWDDAAKEFLEKIFELTGRDY